MKKRSLESKYNYPTMSINIYRFDEDSKLVPLQISENYNAKLDIDLLYHKTENNSHFVLIKDISKLVSSQLSKHDGKRYVCIRCLCSFYKNQHLS